MLQTKKISTISKDPVFWAKFAGYAIPLIFLGYVLYINYLPFGYSKTFTIEVGSENDTRASQFYLEPSQALSERKVAEDGTPYRELNGMATAVFKPNVVLKDATITVETRDEGISIIPPYISLDPASVEWDYAWDFTKGIPEGLTNNKAFYFDGATYFDGTARIEMPDSADLFEDGPFTLYAEWMPMSDEGDGQQIVGHYNWELWQNKTSVSFQVGRMNDAKGPAYKITYPVTKEFFNQKHSIVAIYSPGEQGNITLYIDDKFAGRVAVGTDKIWNSYGRNNLSFGWTSHNYGKNPYYKGGLYGIYIIKNNILPEYSYTIFNKSNKNELLISINSAVTTTFSKLQLNVNQK